MGKSKFSSFVTIGLVIACASAITACSPAKSSVPDNAVAATVNGTEIRESEVTSAIQSIRANNNLSEEDTWGKYLAQLGLTPNDIRQQMIDSFVEKIIIEQNAESLGVSVEDSEVDQYVSNTRSQFENDEAWKKALESVGMTEETYRDNIKSSILQSKVIDAIGAEAQIPTEELDTYASMYGSSLAGARRSSHILFDANDEATAQDVLNRINSGELDFAEAAATYSKDGSAANGGDVGWDKMSNFVTEYAQALSQLDKGQVSGLVKSTYGIHIIKCTDYFNPDPSTPVTYAQLPADFQEAISSMLKSYMAQNNYQTWLEDQKAASDIVINEMPTGVPYNIDMSKYQTATASSGAAASTSATTSDASAASGEASATSGEASAASGESAAASGESSTASGESAAASGESPITSAS